MAIYDFNRLSCFLCIFFGRNSRHDHDRLPLLTRATDGRGLVYDIVVIASRRVIGFTIHQLLSDRPDCPQIALIYLHFDVAIETLAIKIWWSSKVECLEKKIWRSVNVVKNMSFYRGRFKDSRQVRFFFVYALSFFINFGTPKPHFCLVALHRAR